MTPELSRRLANFFAIMPMSTAQRAQLAQTAETAESFDKLPESIQRLIINAETKTSSNNAG
jgi:hypothetical protein